MEQLKGRIIYKGIVEGEALVTSQPLSFYGGVDPNTGMVIEKGHELQGQSVEGKILVFPHRQRLNCWIIHVVPNEKERHCTSRNYQQRM